MIIESSQNKNFKSALLLKEKKYRQESGLFLVEGQKQTEEITGTWNIKNFFVSESFSKKQHYKKTQQTFILSDALFNKLSSTETPQGIIAVVNKRLFSKEKLIKETENGFFVILEKIQDPGNLGNIIRSADAFGAKAVFVSKESADIYSDKTIRSAMGSLFHIPVIDETDTKNIMELMQKEKIKTFAASLDAKTTLKTNIFSKKNALLIGNESRGLSAEIQNQADKLIKIDMPGNAESLNAAVAAAIIMYEITQK